MDYNFRIDMLGSIKGKLFFATFAGIVEKHDKYNVWLKKET